MTTFAPLSDIKARKPESSRKEYLLYLIIAVLPFVMFHWMIPGLYQLSISPDFLRYYIWPQMDYMFALKTGTFPLYFHLTSAGVQSSISIGWCSGYLPIPYIASALPEYWAGNAILWNTLLLLMTIPAAHLALFLFLKRLGLPITIALLLSTTTVYSQRILFSFHSGCGLESWIGHLLLCTSIGLYHLKPSKIKGPLSIIFTTYWLVCSGNPEETYVGILGALVFATVIPYLIVAVIPHKTTSFKAVFRLWCLTALFIIVGISLSSMYVLPFYFDVVRKIEFARMSFKEACVLQGPLREYINSFVNPIQAAPVASIGSTPLIILPILIPFLKIFKVPVPNVIWCLICTVVFIFLCTLGEITPVYSFVWHNLPLASATRTPARFSLMLPILLTLLLVWIFHQKNSVFRKFLLKIKPISLLSALALAIYLVYLLVELYFSKISVQREINYMSYLNLLIIPRWVEPLSYLLGIVILTAAYLYGIIPAKKILHKITCVILFVVCCLQILINLRYHPLPKRIIRNSDILTYEQLSSQKKISLQRYFEFRHLYTWEKRIPSLIVPQLERYFVEPRLGLLYHKYIPAQSREEAYRILNQKRKHDEVVIEGYEAHPQTTSNQVVTGAIDVVDLVYSSYNKLVFKVITKEPAFFLFSYLRDGHWSAILNGKKTNTYRGNGYSHVLPLPSGESILEFRYWSWPAFWGMVLSCITFAGLGIAVGCNIRQKKIGYIVAIISVVLAISILFLWWHSIYNGQNLGTKYRWTSPPEYAPINIAYGKPTQMAKPFIDHHPYMHNSRHGVDGGTDLSSCFVTSYRIEPWWLVDLEKPELIDTIVIYTSLQGAEYDKIWPHMYQKDLEWTFYKHILVDKDYKPAIFNRLPLKIAVSVDGKNWKVGILENLKKNKPNIIHFENPVSARYVKIISSGLCRLSLNEVEIYRTTKKTTIP